MRRLLLVAATAVALLATLLPAAATAHRRDRNHDRIPDKWERQHHLSLKVKQTRRDQDRDGLDNLREWRNHTDPRSRDSDDDGLDDGDEHGQDDDEDAGTVVSFDAETGLLVIRVARDGAEISGLVTPGTEIECEGPVTATASSPGPGSDGDGDDHDNSGPGSGSSGPGSGGDDDDDEGDHDGDDDGDDDERDCGTAALVAGAVVHEAELILASDGRRIWREVELRT